MHSKHRLFEHPPAPLPTPKIMAMPDHKELKLETEDELAMVGVKPALLVRQSAGSRRSRISGPRGRPRRRTGKALLPPEIPSVSMTRQRLRFVVAASPGASNTITLGNVLGAMGVMGNVVNTSVSTLHSSFRIIKLMLWPSVNTATGANSLPEVEWDGGGTTQVAKDNSSNRTVPAGVTASPGVLVSVPPRDTLAGDWLYPASSPSQTLMILYNLTQGCVIDLLVEGTLKNNLSGITITVTTAALATLYWLCLDGGAGKIQPVGKPSTL